MLELIFSTVQGIINIAKEWDIWYGISLWQLFLFFDILLNLIWIIASIFGGSGME